MMLAGGLWPRRLSLSEKLAHLRQPPAGRVSWRDRVAQLGLVSASARRDLPVLGRTAERHVTQKAMVGLTLPVLVLLLWLILTRVGKTIPPQPVIVLAVVVGVTGFFVPDLTIKSEAAEQRRAFRHALSAFLDLTVIALAGGAGPDSALDDAARVGDDWAFARLRSCLQGAKSARRPVWEHLGRLGEEYGVRELTELSAAVSLAGTEGAMVTATLSAKADALRAHARADVEAAAEAATERMVLPVACLMVGFLIFVLYCAVGVFTGGF